MVLWHLYLFSTYDYAHYCNELGYFDISFVDISNIRIFLTDNIDRLIDELRPVDLSLFTLILGACKFEFKC